MCLMIALCQASRGGGDWLPATRFCDGWPSRGAPGSLKHYRWSVDSPQQGVALQSQPALVRSTTLFHWWPQRLRK
jgi:hypothetical protein